MSLTNPYMANVKMMTRTVKQVKQSPGDSQAYGKSMSRSAESRNRKR